jgi:hypothetical protein
MNIQIDQDMQIAHSQHSSFALHNRIVRIYVLAIESKRFQQKTSGLGEPLPGNTDDQPAR